MGIEKKSSESIPLFALAVPLFFEQFFKILVSSIDTFMLSSYSVQAVAAVGMMSQYVFFLNLLFNVVCTGTTIVLAQYIGAKRKGSELNAVAQASAVMIVCVGAFVTVAVFLGTGPLLSCYTLEEAVRKFAFDYFRIFGGFGAVFTALSLMQSAVLRSYGYTKDILVVSVVANIVNVFGNMLSLYGWFGLPVFGLKGVAWSSVAAQVVSCIIFAYRISSLRDVNFSLKGIADVPKHFFRKILSIGLPTAGESISYNVAQIVIMGMITTLGTASMSAQVYTQTIVRFVYVFAIAIGSATQIKTGYYVGAGKKDEAYKKLWGYQAAGTGLSILFILLINLSKKYLVGIFTNDPEITALVTNLLLFSIYIEFGRSVNLISIAALRGAGDVKFPVFYGMFSMWAIMVTGSYFLGLKLGLGLVGFWLSIGTDETTRGIVMLFRWKSKRWQTKAIV